MWLCNYVMKRKENGPLIVICSFICVVSRSSEWEFQWLRRLMIFAKFESTVRKHAYIAVFAEYYGHIIRYFALLFISLVRKIACFWIRILFETVPPKFLTVLFHNRLHKYSSENDAKLCQTSKYVSTNPVFLRTVGSLWFLIFALRFELGL